MLKFMLENWIGLLCLTVFGLAALAHFRQVLCFKIQLPKDRAAGCNCEQTHWFIIIEEDCPVHANQE